LSNLCIVGLDPGAKGCAAFLTGSGATARIELFDLPYVDGHLNYRAYRDLLRRWSPNVAYIENVWPRSSRAPNNKGQGMGFVSGSKFMDNVGALKGITACEVDDCHLVTPVSWKRRFNLLKQPKSESRRMFAELMPACAKLVQRVKDDSRAEAGLISIYGGERQGLFKMVPC